MTNVELSNADCARSGLKASIWHLSKVYLVIERKQRRYRQRLKTKVSSVTDQGASGAQIRSSRAVACRLVQVTGTTAPRGRPIFPSNSCHCCKSAVVRFQSYWEYRSSRQGWFFWHRRRMAKKNGNHGSKIAGNR